MNISKLITETFEKEQPSLCDAIKQAVKANEPRYKFESFLKGVFGPDHKNSVTYHASLTMFDYYKSLQNGR